MKKIYIKPTLEIIDGFLTESVMKAVSWNVQTEGLGKVLEGDNTLIGKDGGPEFTSKGADWNGWDDED